MEITVKQIKRAVERQERAMIAAQAVVDFLKEADPSLFSDVDATVRFYARMDPTTEREVQQAIVKIRVPDVRVELCVDIDHVEIGSGNVASLILTAITADPLFAKLVQTAPPAAEDVPADPDPDITRKPTIFQRWNNDTSTYHVHDESDPDGCSCISCLAQDGTFNPEAHYVSTTFKVDPQTMPDEIAGCFIAFAERLAMSRQCNPLTTAAALMRAAARVHYDSIGITQPVSTEAELVRHLEDMPEDYGGALSLEAVHPTPAAVAIEGANVEVPDPATSRLN